MIGGASPAGAPPCPTRSSPTPTSPSTLDTTDEWIVERTGIRERRIGGTTAGLAAEAGPPPLDSAGVDAADIDLLVLATTTPDQQRARRRPPRCSTRSACECGAVRPQRRLLRLRLRPRRRRTGSPPARARAHPRHRRRDAEPHHRLGRPRHRHPVRRRRRRRRARGATSGPGTCSAGTSGADGTRRAHPLRRRRRHLADGRQGGLPPGRPGHGRLRPARRWRRPA